MSRQARVLPRAMQIRIQLPAHRVMELVVDKAAEQVGDQEVEQVVPRKA